MSRIIHWTLFLLVILIPLTFTVVNSELFEFPKFILLLSGTIIIATTWLAHLYLTHDFTLFPQNTSRANKLIHYSLLGILATQAVATLFSIHPYTSFWGYYSRFHGGLLTTICYTILYFAGVKWLDTESTQKIIKISIRTSIFISLIAIFEHFNLSLTCLLMSSLAHFKDASIHLITNTSCWGASTNPLARSFATVGQPNWLAAYLIPHFFLALYLQQTSKRKSTFPFLAVCTTLILFLALLYTKSRSGFLGFALSYLAYWLLNLRQMSAKKMKSSLIAFSSSLLVVAAVVGTPYTGALTTLFSHKETAVAQPASTGTSLETGGTESGDIRKIVWSGALTLIKQHPLLGTGPETFGYAYYWARPVSHNLTSEWEFLYNKAHNEYLNMAAGAGLIGLLAYLAWHAALGYSSLLKIAKSKKVSQINDDRLRALYPVLGATIVGFAVTNFFGFSVIPVYLLMTFISFLPSTINQEPVAEHISPSLPQYVTLSCLAIIFLVLFPLKLFYADYLYTLGKAQLDAGQPAIAIPLLERAVSYRASEDLYLSSLSESYALLAIVGAKSADTTQQAKSIEYVGHALALVAQTRKHNPWHLNYFKSRAKVFLTLATLDPKYNEQAALELEKARTLAPTDPKLAYNLGLIYTRLGQLDRAVDSLNTAITLKPNYADPYYALILLYEQSKQTAKIPPLATEAKSRLATYSAQLKEKIDKYVQ